MILQSLFEYYEAMAVAGKLAKPGWAQAKISYGINLDDDGKIIGIVSLKETVQRGKKTAEIPRMMVMPEAEKRSSGIIPHFLWDNPAFLLGLPEDGKKAERTHDCFKATAQRCRDVLKNVDTPAALAVLKFFREWDDKKSISNEYLIPYFDDFKKGANLTFLYNSQPIIKDKAIAEAWENFYAARNGGDIGFCSVTGKKAPIARLHPNIKGVKGGQSFGTALVSFNGPAFESYGHKQGLNGNVSEYAAFAYTTALNSLLADDNHHFFLEEMTVAFWSPDMDNDDAEIFSRLCANTIGSKEMKEFFEAIDDGRPFVLDEKKIDPSSRFYIIGLAPNSARLSVKFFMENTFGFFAKNIKKFFDDFNIVRPAYEDNEYIPVWKILQETANKESDKKSSSPLLKSAFLRSVLFGEKYPEGLFLNILLRAKADKDNKKKFIEKISRTKAAAVKAYLIRNRKEEISMALDTERTNPGYLLGRLFAVLEKIQKTASPGLNATIKDKYFNAACATPGLMFPILIKLSNNHTKKFADKKGLVKYFDKKVRGLINSLNGIPARLDQKEQGEFCLGYYQQNEALYQKQKEEN